MPTAKELLRIITKCGDCPFNVVESTKDNGEDPIEWFNICIKTRKEIPPKSKLPIPDWCPLPDAVYVKSPKVK